MIYIISYSGYLYYNVLKGICQGNFSGINRLFTFINRKGDIYVLRSAYTNMQRKECKTNAAYKVIGA